MKTSHAVRGGAAALAIALSTLQLSAQTTAFTYQGFLTENGGPANGVYDLQVTLQDAATLGNPVGSPINLEDVGVTNGLFTVMLDFTATPFDGNARWLDIAVRPGASVGAYTNLAPRQPITSAPYAVRALNISSNALSAFSGPVSFANPGNSFSGTFSGDGSSLSNLNVSTLGGLAASNFWQLGGNAGTSGANFLGTTDNQPLELKVNAARALRVEFATHTIFGYSPNLVAGFPGNMVSNGFAGAVIGGGGTSNSPNRVGADYATVVGGRGNTASGYSSTALGNGVIASGGYSTAMGANTTASSNFSTAMGIDTTASGQSSTAMGNSTTASGTYSTAMGRDTTASANYSTAMGYLANAIHPGTFVWADSTAANFDSTSANQFLIRASGGVGINKNNPATALDVNGTITASHFTGSGAGLTNLNAWQLGGNAGTTPGAQFIGTTDNQPLELKVNSNRAMRLEPTADDLNHAGIVNLVGGSPANSVKPGAYGATIGGGGALYWNGGAGSNRVDSDFGTIGGGLGNTIYSTAFSASIGGGSGNIIQTDAFGSAIGGGSANTIQNLSYYSALGGGWSNSIQGFSWYSTIGGGFDNTIQSSAFSSTIGGGIHNTIQNSANDSVIGGGGGNLIENNSSGSTISGGSQNYIWRSSPFSTIGGGLGNIIQTNANYSVVGGGSQNTIRASSLHSTIGGGINNTIQEVAANSTISGGIANTIQAFSWNSTVGGGSQNTVQTSSQTATIAGGDFNLIQNSSSGSTVSGGSQNAIWSYSPFSTIGGGVGNIIQSNANYSTVGGGSQNTIRASSPYSTIGGGNNNTIQELAADSTISGGIANTIQSNLTGSTIGGGDGNQIRSLSSFSTIGGGSQNTIQSNASFATVPGGRLNSATNYAFAAGYRAKANHTGTFVWADSQDTDFSSSGTNQFLIRASGGVGINTTNPQAPLHVSGRAIVNGADQWDVNNTEGDFRVGSSTHRFKIGVAQGGGGAGDVWMRAHGGTARLFLKTPGGTTVYSNEGQSSGVSLAAGGGSWTSVSDRNAKENFESVDAQDVLAKVAALPLTRWNYKSQDAGIRHLGPMAQDFKAAFGLGETDTGITSVDADGVALAAIQGLNQKVEEREALLRKELQRRDAENASLKRELSEIKRLLVKLAAKGN